MNLSIGILAREKDPYLGDCLSSLSGLPCEIIVVSPSKVDGVKWIKFDWEDDFAKARNVIQDNTSSDMVLHIDSDEYLDQSSIPKFHGDFSFNSIVKISIFSDGTRVVLPRLVHKTVSWIRAAHEIPISNGPIGVDPSILIHHQDLKPEEVERNALYNLSLIEKDFDKTNDPDLLFLCAMDSALINTTKSYYYASRFIQNFSGSSTAKTKMQSLLMEYVMAFIDGNTGRDIPGAISRLRRILVKGFPLAEVWCLLGDLYLKLNAVVQAREMYENALVIGEFIDPLKEDRMWMDLEKYSEYPRAMVSECDKRIQSNSIGRIA